MSNIVKYIHNNVAYYIREYNLKKAQEQATTYCFNAVLDRDLCRLSEYVLDLRTNEVIKARHKLEDLFDILIKDNHD